jgi:hypothetical protein
MYVKVFAQILKSSLAEDYETRHVFMDLLILADSDGVVDMPLASISRHTNVPLKQVSAAVEKLCRPDSQSRSPAEDGRRLVLLDPSRSWGWRIVNYTQYRNLRDEESRKAYMREYMRAARAKARPPVHTNAAPPPSDAHPVFEFPAEEDVPDPLAEGPPPAPETPPVVPHDAPSGRATLNSLTSRLWAHGPRPRDQGVEDVKRAIRDAQAKTGATLGDLADFLDDLTGRGEPWPRWWELGPPLSPFVAGRRDAAERVRQVTARERVKNEEAERLRQSAEKDVATLQRELGEYRRLAPPDGGAAGRRILATLAAMGGDARGGEAEPQRPSARDEIPQRHRLIQT